MYIVELKILLNCNYLARRRNVLLFKKFKTTY